VCDHVRVRNDGVGARLAERVKREPHAATDGPEQPIDCNPREINSNG
jgi:hypothetical protein